MSASEVFRSFLFVPGARPERFAKALAAGADAVCIDLEDAVAPADKETARRTVLDWFEAGRDGATACGVRINSVRSKEGVADLAALATAATPPDFLMVPKVSHPEELAIIGEVLGRTEGLWPIVESASGLSNADAIAAVPAVSGVLFGAVDYAADIGAMLAWEPMLHARGVLVNACSRYGRELLDVPWLDVEDDAGLRETTLRARQMGFTGRACIHPRQVAGVNAAFAPTDAEIAHARRVLAAFDAAGGAAALLDGKLVELPLVRAARRILSTVAH